MLAVLAVVAVVAAGVAIVRVIQLTNERDDLQSENTELTDSLRIARGDAGDQIETLEGEITVLTEVLDATDAALEEATADLERVRTERNQVTTQLADRTTELETATAQLGEMDAQLTELGPIEPMPELVGLELAAAQAFADEFGATLIIEEVAPGNVIARPGDVIEQQPAEGVPLVAGSVIWVQVFTLPEETTDAEADDGG